MATLNQWLSNGHHDDTGIVADLHASYNVRLYRRQNKIGEQTGRIGIQLNFPTGDQHGYRLYGFLESTDTEEITAETIADIVSGAFGIQPNDDVWEVDGSG